MERLDARLMLMRHAVFPLAVVIGKAVARIAVIMIVAGSRGSVPVLMLVPVAVVELREDRHTLALADEPSLEAEQLPAQHRENGDACDAGLAGGWGHGRETKRLVDFWQELCAAVRSIGLSDSRSANRPPRGRVEDSGSVRFKVNHGKQIDREAVGCTALCVPSMGAVLMGFKPPVDKPDMTNIWLKLHHGAEVKIKTQ